MTRKPVVGNDQGTGHTTGAQGAGPWVQHGEIVLVGSGRESSSNLEEYGMCMCMRMLSPRRLLREVGGGEGDGGRHGGRGGGGGGG